MLLLAAILILLSATSVFAQIVPAPSPGSITNPVIQFKSNGFAYQYSPGGGSTMFTDMGNGMTGYTSKDSMGRITSQGTIYNPIKTTPLEAPPYNPPPRSGPPYGGSNIQSIADGPIFSR